MDHKEVADKVLAHIREKIGRELGYGRVYEVCLKWERDYYDSHESYEISADVGIDGWYGRQEATGRGNDWNEALRNLLLSFTVCMDDIDQRSSMKG